MELRLPGGYRHVHFVGIGGIGTSGIARILVDAGVSVSGSDMASAPLTRVLEGLGARVSAGHAAANLPAPAELVIHSAAVGPANPELREATRRGLPVISYSGALGALMADRFGVAVAGTHGKTSTSAMLAFILTATGREPGFVIGGEIPQLGGNSGSGRGEHLVVEACEYRRNFHALRPRGAILTNLEEDHLDCYRDLSDIREAFSRFIALVPPDGFVLACVENVPLSELLNRARARRYTYGFSGADFCAEDIRPGPAGTACRLVTRARTAARLHLGLPGRHNILNALGAFGAACLLGVDPARAAAALGRFTGVRRRFEYRGRCHGADVYDDYAHHPAEISATLEAARQSCPGRRLLVVFQPHQYSRTRFFLDDFVAALAAADRVIVPEIYFVRDSEESRRSVSSADLARRLGEAGVSASYVPALDDCLPLLKREIRAGDVVLTVGAGPVHQVADRLLS